MKVENLKQKELVLLVKDMFHRMHMHEAFWFNEVEHQLGLEKALQAMDYASSKMEAISSKRMAEFMPLDLDNMSPESLLALADAIAKNWLAQDGVWFQAVEFTEGMFDAKRCNDSAWVRFSPLEGHSIKKLLGMPEHPGLEGLAEAMNFRMYGRLNKQSSYFDSEGALIFTMEDCRVQSARIRKGLPDYPCKSAGVVEYRTFATAIDDRIKTSCICCPPDEHPEGCFCRWRFEIKEDK